ncbi:hypothetical protein C0J52_04577 [Blattella germanica]|nr:hypothetical protein C0J52_04577 [Blattella germanica]
MSNSHLFLPSGFPRAPLQNGIGRFVCQLQRLTIKFCKNNGSSRGVREFIEKDLLDFAQNYPGVVVYVKPRRHRGPCLSAEYSELKLFFEIFTAVYAVNFDTVSVNGEKHYVSCRNLSRDEILKWINLLRTQSGNQVIRLRKLWHTDCPSIQGPWSPFEELSRPFIMPKTATDRLKEIFEEQRRNVATLDEKRAE